MFKSGILVLPIDILLEDVDQIFLEVKEYVTDKLYIQFFSEYNFQERSLPKLSGFVTELYRKSRNLLPKTINVILQLGNFRESKTLPDVETAIELLLLPKIPETLRINYQKTYNCEDVIYVGDDAKTSSNASQLHGSVDEQYKTVVLGGTFDRLHTGHKILLTEAVIRATKRIVVGVTDENMTRKGKKLPELIQSTKRRIEDVKKFLLLVDKTIEYVVVPISDPFGPTAIDPDMDMIVVSAETFRGGQKVNEVRQKNGLPLLIIHTIGLIDQPDAETNDILLKNLMLDETKISSSRERFELIGELLRSKNELEMLENVYVIGLKGVLFVDQGCLVKKFIEKGITVIDIGLEDVQEKDQILEKIKKFTKGSTKIIVLDLPNFLEIDPNNICHELWYILASLENAPSNQIEIMEEALDTAHVLLTSSIPIDSQFEKAWDLLLKRVGLF